MALDKSFIDRNRASSSRMREMVARLSDEELQKPVGKYWTVSTTLAHLAFWDLRVIHLLDATERDGKLSAPQIDIAVNDIAHPLWAAIPPQEAARIAIETAAALDRRLEKFPLELLEQVYAFSERWVIRELHRNAHLDAVDAALNQ